jgi:hypothetical protein
LFFPIYLRYKFLVEHRYVFPGVLQNTAFKPQGTIFNKDFSYIIIEIMLLTMSQNIIEFDFPTDEILYMLLAHNFFLLMCHFKNNCSLWLYTSNYDNGQQNMLTT